MDRTAYPRLPPVLSACELEEWFSPSSDEVSWACAKIVTGEFRLMLLVLLKCYQRLGYFPRLDGVPPEAVEYVRGRALEMSGQRIGPWGTLESERMLKGCRELVRDRLGVVWEPTRVREVAGYRGFWTGIRRQSLFLLVNGVLSDLKHGGRFGHMRNPKRS